MKTFFDTLNVLRWDDHRYYHHCRINQFLHLVSAISFVVAYGLLLVDPAVSALLAWLVSMTTRQAGHFFFEPKGYDHVNHATHEHKEAIKVGYNLQRKVVLMACWVGAPALLALNPTLLGLFTPADGAWAFMREVGWIWLWLGVAALAFRMGQLFVQQTALVGLAWGAKILTDPFHDIWLYHKAPLHLMQGQRFAAEHRFSR